MKTKTEKYQAILDRAIALDAKGKTETFLDLARFLTRSGFTNNAGEKYSNPRGVAQVISYAWAYAKTNYGKKEALLIENSFTGASGQAAWR